MGECVRDCECCDVCGFVWIKGPKPPYRCPSQKCRSTLWNRPRKSHLGRPDKGMVRVKQRMSPTLDAEGCHHTLCPCLLCLTATWRAAQATAIGRVRGLTQGGTGKRSGRWKLKVAPRAGVEARGLQEALIRAGVGRDARDSDDAHG